MKISTGSDPEFFITDTQGHIVSSHTAKVRGDKTRPYPLECGFMHRDNVLLELNVPPSTSEEEWVNNHLNCLAQATSEISDNYKYKVADIASIYMDKEELWHPEAMIFGCDADFNAWLGGSKNPSPQQDGTLRSAGGHIHIGYDNPEHELTLRIVKACDLFLAVPSLLMDPDTTRRQLYGKAGCHRIKPYGVEYRTLSNFWTRTPDLLRWAYRNTQRAVDFAEVNDMAPFAEVQHVIDTNDIDHAEYLVSHYNLEVL
jgi:hypothetical protein